MKLKTLPTFKSPKRQPLLTILMVALMCYAGCKEPGLHVEKDSFTLRAEDGTEQKAAGEGKLFWLHNSKEKLKLEALEKLSARDIGQFKQFEKAVALDPVHYKVSTVDDRITIASDKFQSSSPSLYGYLIAIINGQIMIANSAADGCTKDPVAANKSGIVRQGDNHGSWMTWSSVTVWDDDGIEMIQRIIHSEMMAKQAVGDTGTEIIIVDNFSPASGSGCCDTASLNCTPGDTTGEPVDIEGVNLDGWEENFALQIGHGCVYEYCQYLIVANQLTGEIRCYDTRLCKVRLQLMDDGNFKIMLPSDCENSSAVTICPPAGGGN